MEKNSQKNQTLIICVREMAFNKNLSIRRFHESSVSVIKRNILESVLYTQ